MAEKVPFRGFRGFNTPNNTQVPDQLFDEIMVHLSGAELKVLLYVIRRTFGFKRDTDNISLSQMLKGIVKRDGNRLDHGTGLSKPTLLSALRTLAQKGMIVPERRRSSERGDEATSYRLRLLTDERPKDRASAVGEDAAPVVKKFDQGGSRDLTTPLGKELGQAVVKKSAPQVTVTKKQVDKVVNGETPNDHRSVATSSPKARQNPQVISDRALRSKYQLTDEQIGRVHWLVERQTELLGAGERNHGYYVKRAAEAVRDGEDGFLDHQLGDFKQAATELDIGSRPAYFHGMYSEALQKRGANSAARLEIKSMAADAQPRTETFGDLFGDQQSDESEDSRTRMIADAERRGFSVPDQIRTADSHSVSRWWAALPDTAPTKSK